MSHVFQESFRFTSSSESPGRRGFPLAVALKEFWLCFAPRYDPLLWSGQEGKVDSYARAPTQHLFQEDRTADVDARSGIPFTFVSTSCIPSIVEFVSSFPFIKNLYLDLESDFDYSLAPLSQMRLLIQLALDGVTSKHLSEIANVSVKNLELLNCWFSDLSPLFPQEQQQGGRLQRSLRRLTLRSCSLLTDISALAGFETLLELKLDSCSYLTDLSSIAQLKELRVVRVVRVEGSRELEMASFVKAVASLEFILDLNVSFYGDILDEHVRKIATIETLEKLKLSSFLRASSESLSMLLDPQNLPNLRELELTNSTSSPFKHSAGSGPCSSLEKFVFRSHFCGQLDSTDILIIAKKFPNLQCLCVEGDFEDGTDFSPLGDLICLSELASHFRSEFTSVQSASLESAIAKLVNLKELEFDEFPDVDVKKMLVPLRKLEVLVCHRELAASTMNTILDLVEEGHLPVLSNYKFRIYPVQIEFIPELVERRRKLQIEQEHRQQSKKKKKKKHQEPQAERRERKEGEDEKWQ